MLRQRDTNTWYYIWYVIISCLLPIIIVCDTMTVVWMCAVKAVHSTRDKIKHRTVYYYYHHRPTRLYWRFVIGCVSVCNACDFIPNKTNNIALKILYRSKTVICIKAVFNNGLFNIGDLSRVLYIIVNKWLSI